MGGMDKKLGDKVHITEEVVKAAASNWKSGREVVVLLLNHKGDKIQTTERVVVEIARNFNEKVITLLLERNSGRVRVTEEVVKAAVANEWNGKDILILLLDQERGEVKVTEEIIKAAAANGRNGKEVMALLLDRRSGSIKIDDQYMWTVELLDIGYTDGQIVDLLFETVLDSPWIYFQPTATQYTAIDENHHLDGCIHQLHAPLSHCFNGATVKSSQIDQEVLVRRHIEELCGLGGITPSRETSSWNGSIQFEEQNSVAFISYAYKIPITNTIGDVISHLIRVVEKFITAARTVQNAGFCCNSFTVLRRCSIDKHGTASQVKLVCLKFSLAMAVLECLTTLETLHGGGADLDSELKCLLNASYNILVPIGFVQNLSKSGTDLLQHVFHIASLAIQYLCIGFLSYSQAHIGHIQPFFLDTTLQQIMLLGMSTSTESNAYLQGYLVRLTCLDGMIQNPVFVFCEMGSESSQFTQTNERFDVSASLEDVLDTWGPGELVFTGQHTNSPFAIKLSGGYIQHPVLDEKYHWHNLLEISSRIPLDLRKEVLIGSLIHVNVSCSNDEDECWKKTGNMREELGTYRDYFQVTENQIALQGGPDHLAVTMNRFYWGVRVSFCTGVAQRVRLRELVADMLPVFQKIFNSKEEQERWLDLEKNHSILETFRDNSPNQMTVLKWLNGLPKELHSFVHQLVRQVLTALKDTGLTPDRKYFSVAWLQEGLINRGLQIPLSGRTDWMVILADSDDCATFAYISGDCLETESIKCRGKNSTWENQILLLETAVLCPGMSSWALSHEGTYHFRKLDNLFWVKAQKNKVDTRIPSTLTKLAVIESIPQSIKHRLLLSEETKGKQRLRERELSQVTAETVFIVPKHNR
ncbi:hypothetical protein DM02DRAFT_698019 [Periconia macrospinosa]|uniref:Uncharacterized protein n=1 Tax=Periconia macrospinosa TaxID=97972 RepID=A0A2V1D4I6_9PLEO|nr:hypothetical protein DM02DRAFT_698019 [Periconia macrospinosa]